MEDHGHAAPEEDHSVTIKVGIFFIAVIISLFIIGAIN